MTTAGGWCVMGVDLGSTTAKAAVVDESGALIGSSVIQMGAVSREAVARAMDGALAAAGVSQSDIRRTISTGYGRKLVPGTDRTFTEITCHARGAAALHPGVRLVIDIGGAGQQGHHRRRRRPRGTVRHERPVRERDRPLLRRARAGTRSRRQRSRRTSPAPGSENLEISSMCATFAETEVISLLAQGREQGRHRRVGAQSRRGAHTRIGGAGG